eukprot:m.1215490 g.1215490  ORF g.1215490 m.1215490 type:complete len:502 (+) comp24611_c0_seq3:133-1638(+)
MKQHSDQIENTMVLSIFLYFALFVGFLRYVLFTLIVFIAKYYVHLRNKGSLQGKNILERVSVAQQCTEEKIVTVGFFHPYCNAGGGGERVLWVAVNALCQAHENIHIIVYTGDIDATSTDIINTARGRFGIDVDISKVSFVFLKSREWVEAAHYPRFTMLFQTLGSAILGWEALCEICPDVFIDSMGYSMTLPMFRIFGGCRIGCYVHYPTISTDMLGRVERREQAFNNSVSNSRVLSELKLIYYRLFAALYGWAGSFAKIVLVNSTWTHDHIVTLWKHPEATHIVYPPCNTKSLAAGSLAGRRPTIVSVAQFRPEKNHALQLRSFAGFLQQNPDRKGIVKLVMIGGCRNAGDEARVAELHRLTAELGLQNDVEVLTNVPYGVLLEHLATATAGIHTMRDEHFGIGVVEFMAAGVLPVAHNSAGPRMDIVRVTATGQATGFLAETQDEYADALGSVFSLSAKEREAMQVAARDWAEKHFSDAAFEQLFVEKTLPLFEADGL